MKQWVNNSKLVNKQSKYSEGWHSKQNIQLYFFFLWTPVTLKQDKVTATGTHVYISRELLIKQIKQRLKGLASSLKYTPKSPHQSQQKERSLHFPSAMPPCSLDQTGNIYHQLSPLNTNQSNQNHYVQDPTHTCNNYTKFEIDCDNQVKTLFVLNCMALWHK